MENPRKTNRPDSTPPDPQDHGKPEGELSIEKTRADAQVNLLQILCDAVVEELRKRTDELVS